MRRLVDESVLDELLAQARGGGLALTGRGGFLSDLVASVLERALAVEMSDHLGYEKGDPAGRVAPNARNGSTPKTLQTEIGPVPIAVPRDREGSFSPVLIPKGARRLGGLSDVIISLYAGGMTVRDIEHHLARTYGTELSRETISKITDEVVEEAKAWQSRPLEAVYPIVYVDALSVKIRTGQTVSNKSCHLVLGVGLDGAKHVLGIWIGASESASFWAGVLTELRNRGVSDILYLCCDGLTGLPDAVASVFPNAVTQTCVVHLIRASMRYVNHADRKKLAAALRPIYTAATVEAAEDALLAFGESDLGKRYPSAVATWHRAWDRFIPFLGFPPEVRKIIYTTNAIESLNYQIRKIIKNRGHFPSDDAAIKLIWLAIRDIEDKRARARDAERGAPRNQRKAPGRLIEGQVTQGWNYALQALNLAHPGRIPADAI